MLRNGYTEKDIVREYRQAKFPYQMVGILKDLAGCSRQEIVDILQKSGEPVGAIIKWTPELIEKALCLKEKGMTNREIASLLNMPTQKVTNKLKYMKVKGEICL